MLAIAESLFSPFFFGYFFVPLLGLERLTRRFPQNGRLEIDPILAIAYFQLV